MNTAASCDAVEILETLVGFPTVSSGSNLALIEYVRDFLRDHGVDSHLVFNVERTKANLYSQIGPNVAGGVILSGHTDVVPVADQAWSGDPFRLREQDGRLYGRGTADMKGFIAAVLALVPEWRAARLKRPVQLALSYDEEVGCLGAPSMIAEMSQRLAPAKAVIVGEPTMMKLVTGHKTFAGFETRVRGREVHSCQPHLGVSAVMTAARLVCWLQDRTDENRQAASAEGTGPNADEAGFDPPWTTLHAGMISGGTATNITAGHCRFSTDIRCMPGDDPDDWVARYRSFASDVDSDIRSAHPEAAVYVSDPVHIPGLSPEADGAAERLVRQLNGDNETGVVSYGTEAGQFQAAKYSTVVCGPGSIDQAHQPDEFIARRQIDACAGFLQRLTRTLSD